MFLYRVGYFSYEECPQVALSHERRIEPAEFEEMCLSCSVDVARGMLGKNLWLDSFRHIYDQVVDLLIERHGFSMAEFVGDFRPFGWASMFDASDWEGERDGDLVKLTDRMLSVGFKSNVEDIKMAWRVESKEQGSKDDTRPDDGGRGE